VRGGAGDDGGERAGLGAGEGASGEGVGDSPESPDSLASGLGAPPPLDTDSALDAVAGAADLEAGAVVTDLGAVITLVWMSTCCGIFGRVGFRVPVFGGSGRGRGGNGRGATPVVWPRAVAQVPPIVNNRMSTGKSLSTALCIVLWS
jgi:hypothetical protein